MSDSQKLSRARWAIRDIVQFLQSDRRVQRSRVEKAARCLKEADFADSAALLEAEFRPVSCDRQCTPELLSFVQSLFASVDAAVSQRMKHEICPEGVGNTTTPDQPTGDNGQPSDPESQPPAVKPRKTRAEYNIEARKYLQEHPEAGPRELIAALGCGTGTVYKLPAYQAVAAERKKGRKPKAVSLTKPMADVTAKADGDGELAKLSREQRRDDRTHKVSSRGRL